MDTTLLLAQSEAITKWLTPVWLLSVGAWVGMILVVLLLLVLYLFSKTPVINQIYENRRTHLVSTVILGLILLGGLAAWPVMQIFQAASNTPNTDLSGDLLLLFLILVPVSLFLAYGFWAAVSRKRFNEILDAFRDGFLYWLTVIGTVLSAFAVIGYLLTFVNGFGLVTVVDRPEDIMRSVSRLPATGVYQREFTIPQSDDSDSGQLINIGFDGTELKWFQFGADQQMELSVSPITGDLSSDEMLRIIPYLDTRRLKTYFKRLTGDPRFPNRKIEGLYVRNVGSSPGLLTLQWKTEPEFPQTRIIPITAVVVVSTFLLYIVFIAGLPKLAAIAVSTFKTEVSQPVFLVLMFIGVIFVIGSIYIPYNTFGEDIKMYKDSGLTLIRVLGIFLAVWAASKSVAEEIEGRTALTVLSKPVSRRQFIFGKFVGIGMTVGLLFLILGIWFLIWTAYKPVYDSVETAQRDFEWTLCFTQAMSILPAMVLVFLETLIFVAISVAMSTRFGILANFLICFAIYVLGHLTPLIVQSAEAVEAFESVVFFGQVLAIIFPVLDHFDVQAAINGEFAVPISYLGWSLVYCALYSSIAMLLALVLFEDRDLA